jgi:hypothetical protein
MSRRTSHLVAISPVKPFIIDIIWFLLPEVAMLSFLYYQFIKSVPLKHTPNSQRNPQTCVPIKAARARARPYSSLAFLVFAVRIVAAGMKFAIFSFSQDYFASLAEWATWVFPVVSDYVYFVSVLLDFGNEC